jgi:Fe-S cluster biosynthesis and repair protein YggX
MSNEFECRACPARAARAGAEVTTGTAIAGPVPFGSPLREELLAAVCDTCWKDWLQMQIKIINELALNLGDARSHDILEAHARDFLGLGSGESGTDFAKIGEKPPATTEH